MISCVQNTIKALLSGWADFFWIAAGSIFFSILFSHFVVTAVGSVNGNSDALQTLLFITSVGSAAAFFSIFLVFWPKLSFFSHSKPRSVKFALFFGFLLIAAKMSLNRAFDENDPFSPFNQSVLAIILICFIVPVVEEAFFRGLIWATFLKRSISESGVISATSLLFTLSHFPSDFNSFIQACGMGFTLGIIRLFSGSIWLGVLFHSIVNIVVFFNL